MVGGYDASDTLGYGMFSCFLKKKLATSIYKNVDYILPVDESLKNVI